MNYHHELRDEIMSYLKRLQPHENMFGATTAILKYGQVFKLPEKKPDWLQISEPRNCFNNATACAVTRPDIHYAEGYALAPDLPIPVQHAWLVDSEGQVLDPTWPDTQDHVYFGIAFRRQFVIEMLTSNADQAGLLVNMHLLRKHFSHASELEEAIRAGRLEIPSI